MKIKEILDELLTQMAKLEMEIGDLILEHRHCQSFWNYSTLY